MALNVSVSKNWSDYEATSSTSLTINQGSLTALSLTISTGKAYQAGDDIALVPTAAKIPFMLIGTVTSYDSNTGALVANVTRLESTIPSWDLVSASSNTIGTGAKTFVTYNSKSALLAASDTIMVSRRGTNGGNRFFGTVTSYTNADGTLVMNCTATVGSGTSQTDWIITSAGTFSAWKIVPAPTTSITLTTTANLTFDQEPSYPIGSLVTLDRGRFIFTNASTTTPWVVELSSKQTNGAKLFQLENNGRVDVTGGAMITVATGTGSAGQTISFASSPYTKIDFPCVEVETGNGTGIYRPWYVVEDGATDRGYLGKNWISRGYKSTFDTARSSTVTLTTASPTVITWTSHGLRPGQRVRFTTTGTYTGITTGTDYYVQADGFTTSAFKIATSPIAAAPIGVTAQSGTHTATVLPEYGAGLQGNVLLWNPTTRVLTCGNGTVGNVIPSGAKVRIPNIHFTSESPRSPILSAISSATAGNAVTFVTGNVSALLTQTGMTFYINQEEFTGTFSGSTMTTTARALNGTVAANHAQGDTCYSQQQATATTTTNRALFDTADGGIVNLNKCSFGNVILFLSNPQDCTIQNTWITGGCNIGTTTASFVVNGLYCNQYPQADGVGITIQSILGSLSVRNVYSVSSAAVSNTSPSAVAISNCQNVTAMDTIEGFCQMRNGTSTARGVNVTACILNGIAKNITSIGGRVLIQNMSRFEMDGIIQGAESNGTASANVSDSAIVLANCQYAILRNITLPTSGAACRSVVCNTDANCSNVLFHTFTYDCQSNAASIGNGLGNNITYANGTFGTIRDSSGTTSGGWSLGNTSTGDTVTVRNCSYTVTDTYGADNGLGETARCFVEQSTGHSMWWRAAGNAFSGNFQEMGPFHVLLDNGTKATGTLFAQFSVKAQRDIYTLNGGAYLNNGGSVFLPTTGDYIILKSYQNLRTITGFTGVVTVEGVNTGNYIQEFEMVGTEASFTGTYTSLTTANLNAALAAISGYSDAKGFKLRVKITATADNAANQVINLRMFTTNNAATALPIGYVNCTVSNLSSGTTVAAYDGSTELFYAANQSGSCVVPLPYAYDGNTKTDSLKIRGYLTTWNDNSQTFNQYDFSYIAVQLTDSEITQTTVATVAAYTTLDTSAQVYDYAKYWGTLRANLTTAQVCTKASGVVNFGSYNIVIDATASSVFSVAGGTITIKSTTFAANFTTTGTVSFVNGAAPSSTSVYTSAAGTSVPVTAPNLISGSRVQIYNVTNSVELDNQVIGSGGYKGRFTWTADKTVRLTATYLSGLVRYLPVQTTGTMTSTGLSFLNAQTADTVYAGNAVDGSTVTEFSADYPNVQVDISDPDNVTTIQRLYAWACYNETTSLGVVNFVGAITATDVLNYTVNTSVASIYLDNVKPQGVAIRGGWLYRSDGAIPVAATSTGPIYFDSGIRLAPSNPSLASDLAVAVWAQTLP